MTDAPSHFSPSLPLLLLCLAQTANTCGLLRGASTEHLEAATRSPVFDLAKIGDATQNQPRSQVDLGEEDQLDFNSYTKVPSTVNQPMIKGL